MMDDSMSKEELGQYLSQPIIARLATIGKDGYPNVHPLWFLYQNEEIIISTGKDTTKTKNIKANPNVGIIIDTVEETGLKAVIFRGKADLIDDETKETTKKVLLKYLGTEDDPMFQMLINMPRTIIKIKPEKIVSWDRKF